MKMDTQSGKTTFRFVRLRPVIWFVVLFSLFANLLLLTGPLFMLQVYDRVLTSQSMPTLLALGILAGLLFAFYGILDYIRTRVMAHIGSRLHPG